MVQKGNAKLSLSSLNLPPQQLHQTIAFQLELFPIFDFLPNVIHVVLDGHCLGSYFLSKNLIGFVGLFESVIFNEIPLKLLLQFVMGILERRQLIVLLLELLLQLPFVLL